MPRSTDPRVNPFAAFASGRDSTAALAVPVSPADASDLAVYARALRVLNEGAGVAVVRVTYAGEESDAATVDLRFPAGLTIEPSAVRRVWQSGTTPGLSILAYIG